MLQDFLTGRPSIANEATGAAAVQNSPFQPLTGSRLTPLSTPAAPAQPERLAAPKVEVIEEEGKVRRIVVTCTCCERIEIECEY